MITTPTETSLVRQEAPDLVSVAPDPIESALSLWAETTTRPETRERAERMHDKRQIIRALLDFTQKHPGEIGLAEVQAWRQALEGQGKSENTISSYLSRVSSFYEWLR